MKRLLYLVLSFLALFTLLFAVGAALGLTDEFYREKIASLQGTAGGFWLIGLTILILLTGDLLFPIPSSLLMVLSGYFLGVVGGTLFSLAGSMGAALLGFGLCRRYGQRYFTSILGNEEERIRVERLLERYGSWAILLSRAVPMVTEIMSCVAGLSNFSFTRFFLLSLAGTFPLCLVYAWAGSQGLSDGGWGLWLAFILPALGFGFMQLIHRRQLA